MRLSLKKGQSLSELETDWALTEVLQASKQLLTCWCSAGAAQISMFNETGLNCDETTLPSKTKLIQHK